MININTWLKISKAMSPANILLFLKLLLFFDFFFINILLKLLSHTTDYHNDVSETLSEILFAIITSTNVITDCIRPIAAG